MGTLGHKSASSIMRSVRVSSAMFPKLARLGIRAYGINPRNTFTQEHAAEVRRQAKAAGMTIHALYTANMSYGDVFYNRAPPGHMLHFAVRQTLARDVERVSWCGAMSLSYPSPETRRSSLEDHIGDLAFLVDTCKEAGLAARAVNGYPGKQLLADPAVLVQASRDAGAGVTLNATNLFHDATWRNATRDDWKALFKTLPRNTIIDYSPVADAGNRQHTVTYTGDAKARQPLEPLAMGATDAGWHGTIFVHGGDNEASAHAAYLTLHQAGLIA